MYKIVTYFKIVGMNTLKGKDEEAQELIKNLQVFEAVCSKIHKSFVSKVIFFIKSEYYIQFLLYKYLICIYK